jgi:excisionase family DNA binding protein
MSKEIEPLLLTIPQAATALHVSVGTIWNMFSDGELAFVKIRGSRRIPIEEIKRVASHGTRTKTVA